MPGSPLTGHGPACARSIALTVASPRAPTQVEGGRAAAHRRAAGSGWSSVGRSRAVQCAAAAASRRTTRSRSAAAACRAASWPPAPAGAPPQAAANAAPAASRAVVGSAAAAAAAAQPGGANAARSRAAAGASNAGGGVRAAAMTRSKCSTPACCARHCAEPGPCSSSAASQSPLQASSPLAPPAAALWLPAAAAPREAVAPGSPRGRTATRSRAPPALLGACGSSGASAAQARQVHAAAASAARSRPGVSLQRPRRGRGLAAGARRHIRPALPAGGSPLGLQCVSLQKLRRRGQAGDQRPPRLRVASARLHAPATAELILGTSVDVLGFGRTATARTPTWISGGRAHLRQLYYSVCCAYQQILVLSKRRHQP